MTQHYNPSTGAMVGAPDPLAAYRLDLTPHYRKMQAVQKEIAQKARRGLTPDGVAVRLSEARQAALDAIRHDAGRTVAKARARMTAIEKELSPQPISSFGLDVRTHKLQAERDRIAAMSDVQLADHVAALSASDPMLLDREMGAIAAGEARRRGIKDGLGHLVADGLAVTLATPPHAHSDEWQQLSALAGELETWDASPLGCQGGANSNPMLFGMSDNVIGGTIQGFDDVFATVLERELPPVFEGGVIGGGTTAFEIGAEQDANRAMIVGAGPNVL